MRRVILIVLSLVTVVITGTAFKAIAGKDEIIVMASCSQQSGDALTYAGCVIGGLTLRELEKCLEGNQCYGPNNDFRKVLCTFGLFCPEPPPQPNRVTLVTQLCQGVLVAWSYGQIYLSPDGQNLGGGGRTELVYSAGQRVRRLVPFKCGVIQVFEQGGVYFSPDGRRLGINRIYSGTQSVVAMIPFKGGVLTQFNGGGVYFSPDGINVGGGGKTVRVYAGQQRLVRVLAAQNGVYARFSEGGCYLSPDGNNIGGGGNTKRIPCPPWLSLQ